MCHGTYAGQPTVPIHQSDSHAGRGKTRMPSVTKQEQKSSMFSAGVEVASGSQGHLLSADYLTWTNALSSATVWAISIKALFLAMLTRRSEWGRKEKYKRNVKRFFLGKLQAFFAGESPYFPLDSGFLGQARL